MSLNVPSDMPRTTCGCSSCTVGCKTMPGCLVPGDLERIQDFVGDHRPEFVLEHFVASDGAKVAKKIKDTTYIISVPSIVPAQKADGSCVFLDENNRCKIHPVSPFGCSRHDTHMSKEEGDRRMTWGVTAQIEAHQQGAPFSLWCQVLDGLNLKAAPLEQRKAAMNREFERVQHEQPGG